MEAFDISKAIGESTDLVGNERRMYTHSKDSNLLVGIEHARNERTSVDMTLYYLTGNVFYNIFPDNFPKIVSAGEDVNGTQYSIVRKIDSEKVKFGDRYIEVKKKFIDTISSLFSLSTKSAALEAFDFEGSQPNLLIAKDGSPVYVDKINPGVLGLIDLDRLEIVIGNQTKANILKTVIQRAVKIYTEEMQRKKEVDELMESLIPK